ncbi:hypothetical protein C7999DRAFT_32239 [Corynascus novoguineensis]|uniref:enoyl-[acyl-carrier-protein] reductase n=1 Tax=Corynascus novoguineensis TaxID=1126955 RepID=A0AAN7HF68_9PEZI|nr:hypothetical protein C7999DRAFT_32239 [Corynascus novoguineensis]
MAQSLVYSDPKSASASSQAGATRPYRLVSHPIPLLPPSATPADNDDDGHVLVRFLAAPVNRVDLMVLAGQYPVKPKYTASQSSSTSQEGQESLPIPGFDGCAVVEHSTSPRFAKGDLVLPRDLGRGTWRTHAALPARALLGPLPQGVDPIDAALIRSGALIARLLLDEVTPIHKGDWVIASAGTSTVAQFLAQLAAQRGIRVALVVRDRPEGGEGGLEEVKAKLLAQGAAAVLSESELERELALSPPDKRTLLPKAEPIILALDSVFGHVGELLTGALAPKGKFVLVGLLAGPAATLTLTTQHLFARQLSFLPFRGSEHLQRLGEARADELVAELARMFVDGTLKRPDVKVVDWTKATKEEVEEALELAVATAKGKEAGHVKTVWKLT